MITKLLIANRGEVVCRIARTAHRLGISTVGVYSDPDANALHVDAVDVAVSLGGATPNDSYLRGDAIIDAARRTGADAIHPGYGFLAESAEFASEVIAAGLTWVGPQPRQIALLGNKVSAKKAAIEAGVPTTPMTEVVSGRAPAGLSMPVLVKAAAGGGGRGMRVVRQHIDMAEAIDSASREAEAAFGDGTVFIEPYIERGRHIEVQIIGDGFGTVLHLGDRECSIQRRNQKIVEEAPAPSLSDELRSELIDGALALARHVGYEGAGTVEFMVGADGSVAFLEVNTRLQVEHPVTEAITGLDLVELQLIVASGRRLPISQADVHIDGHAIEVRIVAEDPASGWLPDVGTITRFSISEAVRVDTGIAVGSTVSSDYDSMLAKVIAHAPTRPAAASLLRRALVTSHIAGVKTNVDALGAILSEVDFLMGETYTSYLNEHPDIGAAAISASDFTPLLLAATFALERVAASQNDATPFAPSGWRNLRTQGQRRTWTANGSTYDVEYSIDAHDQSIATVMLGSWPEPLEDGSLPDDEREPLNVRILRRPDDPTDGTLAIEVDGTRTLVDLIIEGDVYASSSSGHTRLSIAPLFVEPDHELHGGGPVAPLPGTVLAVHVNEGDHVDDGQLLIVVEAMKMEHRIVAQGGATVSAVRFAVGDRVDTGDLLIEFLEDDSGD